MSLIHIKDFLCSKEYIFWYNAKALQLFSEFEWLSDFLAFLVVIAKLHYS